jgi:hypothetical protein
VPGAATQGTSRGNPTFASFCLGPGATLPTCTGGTRVNIPTGTITTSASQFFNNWQASGRIDHRFNDKHSLGGRYLFSDIDQGGTGQATPPGLTQVNPNRTQAMTVFLTSSFNPRTLNELRLSWQRLGSVTTASDPQSETIPSIEIPEMGLKGFNAASDRTAIGLAVNLPQSRTNNTYQLQETIAWTRGPHALKFGIDFRRIDAKSFFVPTIRGRLQYQTVQPSGLAVGTVSVQNFINDIGSVADINKPLPGGVIFNYYRWYDYFFFAQDTWQVHPTLSLSLGLRYETPGNAIASLYPVNDNIVQANGGNSVFLLNPKPQRDLNNFQPRVGFSWNPRTRDTGLLGRLTGGNKLVVRGGYARTNDYQFINLALNVASSFPYLAASSNPNLLNAFTQLPLKTANLSNVAAPDCAATPSAANCLTGTVLASDFRAPIAEQFSLEVQRGLWTNSIFRIGYVGTKGTGLFQTNDGNPHTLCSAVPITRDSKDPTKIKAVLGCPRVFPNKGVIRLRANSGSSIYHSLQLSYDHRFAHGLGAGAHYTWSSFIDSNSDTFNPSPRAEIAVVQNAFDPRADRARSTYDRPKRFSTNAVYELPFYRSQSGPLGRLLGGWQIAGFLTFQSGTPFTPLNGSDPTSAESGIDGLVGLAMRPNLNTTLPISSMSLPELLAAGGPALFKTLQACTPNPDTTINTCTPVDRFGNVGRNVLRGNKLKSVDVSISKTTRLFGERQKMQFRADFFNLTNTRNYGIPEATVTNSGFLDQAGTDGGNRRIFFGLKYFF